MCCCHRTRQHVIGKWTANFECGSRGTFGDDWECQGGIWNVNLFSFWALTPQRRRWLWRKKNIKKKTKRQYGEMRSLTRSVETLSLLRLTFLSIYDNLFFTSTLVPIVHSKAFERVGVRRICRRASIYFYGFGSNFTAMLNSVALLTFQMRAYTQFVHKICRRMH